MNDDMLQALEDASDVLSDLQAYLQDSGFAQPSLITVTEVLTAVNDAIRKAKGSVQ